MWEWRLGQTARQKKIGIESECDGSPKCAGAIHIWDIESQAWLQIHLTREEVKWVRRMLKVCLREYDREHPWATDQAPITTVSTIPGVDGERFSQQTKGSPGWSAPAVPSSFGTPGRSLDPGTQSTKP